jgi:hypothetical protein
VSAVYGEVLSGKSANACPFVGLLPAWLAKKISYWDPDPPLNVRTIDPVPTAADKAVGVVGAEVGVAELDAEEATEVPLAFVAVTV